jgi:hypothetical protein
VSLQVSVGIMPEIYTDANTIGTLEMPAARSAAATYPTPQVVSSSTWSSSPAGQTTTGTLIPSLPDSTTAQRTSTAGAVRQPYIQSVAPASGSHLGGTTVTISGWGLTAATAASFAGVNGTAFTVVNDSTITCTTPAGSVGPVNVVVVSPGGSGISANAYTYT